MPCRPVMMSRPDKSHMKKKKQKYLQNITPNSTRQRSDRIGLGFLDSDSDWDWVFGLELGSSSGSGSIGSDFSDLLHNLCNLRRSTALWYALIYSIVPHMNVCEYVYGMAHSTHSPAGMHTPWFRSICWYRSRIVSGQGRWFHCHWHWLVKCHDNEFDAARVMQCTQCKVRIGPWHVPSSFIQRYNVER